MSYEPRLWRKFSLPLRRFRFGALRGSARSRERCGRRGQVWAQRWFV